MKARRNTASKGPKLQLVQVQLTIRLPKQLARIRNREVLTRQFLNDAMALIAAGEQVAGVTVEYVSWERKGKLYEYGSDRAEDALQDVIRAGFHPEFKVAHK